MSEEFTVVFGDQTLEVNLYDPLSADALTAIAGYAAAASEDASDATAAAAIALAAAVAADWRAERAVRRLAMTAAAAGDAGAVKLVLTEDAARTYESGVGPTLATLTAETGQVFTTTTAFGGSPKAFQTADGIVPSYGLTFSGATIFPAVGDCSVDLFFIQPPVAGSFATLAAMNAAAASFTVGQVVYAANPAAVMLNTYGNQQPLADTLLGLFNSSGDFNQGYWLKRPTPYDDFVRYKPEMLSANLAATPGDNRLEIAVDMLGRHSGFAYQAALGANAPRAYRQNMIAHAPGKVQHLRIDQQDGVATLWWNGDEVGCEGYIGKTAVDFLADALSLAGPWTLKAVVGTQGCTFAQRRAVTDAWADEMGTPRLNWTPVAEIVAIDGQSEFTGAGGTSTDTWRPYTASGWSGEVVGRSDFDLGQDVHQPGVYSGRALTDSARIGPRHFSAGMGGGGTSYGTVAGIAGFASEWRRRPGGGNHLYFVGKCVGGTSLAQLQASSGRYLHAIGEGAVGDIDAALYGELGDRALIEVCKRISARGQTARLIYLAQFQGKTDVGISTTVADHVADLQARLDRAMALIGRGQSRPPLLASMALDFTYGGVNVDTNGVGTSYLDDQYRRMTESRTIDEPILPLTSLWKFVGPNIHWTADHLNQLMAFIGGRAADHMLLGKYIRPLEPVAVELGSGADAGKVVITYPRPVVAVAQLGVTIPSVVQTGGFNTYGYGVIDAIGPGLAINGNLTLTNASGTGFLKVKVPYTGAWAAGDKLTYLGLGSLHGNIVEAVAATGVFNGQDWGATFPLPVATPTINYAGPLHDLREGAAGFAFTWNGSAFV